MCADRLTTASTARVSSSRVGRRGAHPLLRLDDPRGRDQLLGAGDLGSGLDRPDPLPDRAKLCSHALPSPPTPTASAAVGTRLVTASPARPRPRPWARRGSSDTSIPPPVISKPRRNSSIASLSAVAVSSFSSPVSLIDVVDAVVVALQRVEELLLEPPDVLDRHVVEVPAGAGPHRDHLPLHRERAVLRLLEQFHQARAPGPAGRGRRRPGRRRTRRTPPGRGTGTGPA